MGCYSSNSAGSIPVQDLGTTCGWLRRSLPLIKSKEVLRNIKLVMYLYVGRVGLYIGPGRVVTGGQR